MRKTAAEELYDQLDCSFSQYITDNADTFTDENSASLDDVSQLAEEFSLEQERYEHSEVVKNGASKKIIRTYDSFTQRTIALAMLRNETPEPLAIKNFIDEARLTASLQHPNIISVHDIGFTETRKPYFTMDYIDGQTLGNIISELQQGNPKFLKRYPLSILIQIFLKACSAVEHAHKHNIVHLDLKPGNILVDIGDNAYIYDWGIAINLLEEINQKSKHLTQTATIESVHAISPQDIPESHSGRPHTAHTIRVKIMRESTDKAIVINEETRQGAISGTPGYMAPEQASARTKKTGKRTDIYALGAILYSILTYETSVTGHNLEEVLNKTLNGTITTPSLRSPQNSIPAALESIALKAMSKNVNERYQSATEMIGDIRLFLRCDSPGNEGSAIFSRIKGLMHHKN